MAEANVFLFSILVAISNIFVFEVANASEKTFRIALSQDYAPWSWGQQYSVQGLSVDLLRDTLEKQMKYKVEFTGFPWARAQLNAFEGKYDALSTVVSTQRLKYLKASKVPLYVASIKVYVRNTPTALNKVKGVKDLKTLNAAPLIFNVYNGSGWALDHLEQSKIEYSNSLENSIRKLAAGRGDAIVDGDLAMRYFIKELGLEKEIKELPVVVGQLEFFLLVQKNSPLDLDRFDEVLAAYVKSKAYRETVKKYIY